MDPRSTRRARRWVRLARFAASVAVASVVAGCGAAPASSAGAAAQGPSVTPTRWPLINPTPRACPAYTQGAAAPWPTVDPRDPSSLDNFDPCALRGPKRADALRPTGGPYISRDAIERRVVGTVTPSKIRSYLVTHAAANRLTGGDSDDPGVYPDREVWLVVVAHDPHQCARPSLAAGATPWPRRWCYGVYDATTGNAYYGGGNGPSDGAWPRSLPPD